MSGLSLRTGAQATATISTPTLPPAARTSTAGNRAANVAQRAYGISAGTSKGPRRAALGSVSVGVVSLGILMFLWWSLPR